MEKSVKKIPLSIAIATAAALALVGCSAGTGSGSDEPQGLLEQVQERDEVVIGVRTATPPWGFIPEGQEEPDGIDIDLAYAFADHLGVDSVKFVEVNGNNQIMQLRTGKVDMLISAMAATPERKEAIAFSMEYFGTEQKLLVHEGSPIAHVRDLDGKRIGVTQGGFEEGKLREVAPENIDVISYGDFPQALQALLRGDVDAVSTSESVLYNLLEAAAEDGHALVIVGDPIGKNNGAAAGFRKEDNDLREAFDEMLEEMAADGSIYELQEKWFPNLSRYPVAS